MIDRRRQISWWVAVAAMVVNAACAGNPAPGEPGYRFNLNGTYDALFSAQGTDFTGAAELSTAPGGVVTGIVKLTSPEAVTADLEGTVADSSFRFEATYSRSGGCEGALMGRGEIRPDGAGTSGGVDIADDCLGGMMEGRFRFSRP
jgi:hypothetical protein